MVLNFAVYYFKRDTSFFKLNSMLKVTRNTPQSLKMKCKGHLISWQFGKKPQKYTKPQPKVTCDIFMKTPPFYSPKNPPNLNHKNSVNTLYLWLHKEPFNQKNFELKRQKNTVYILTSECCPGFSILPHSSHFKHFGCHDLPSECFCSAKINKKQLQNIQYKRLWRTDPSSETG